MGQTCQTGSKRITVRDSTAKVAVETDERKSISKHNLPPAAVSLVLSGGASILPSDLHNHATATFNVQRTLCAKPRKKNQIISTKFICVPRIEARMIQISDQTYNSLQLVRLLRQHDDNDNDDLRWRVITLCVGVSGCLWIVHILLP
jgi:hypothetical protein